MTTGPRLVVAAIGLAVVAFGCGPGAAAGGPAPSAPPDGAVIIASNMSFDRAEVDVPADRPFQLLFENRDGAPHNVTVLGPAGGDALFVGEVFSGSASRLYEVPAIAAGSYPFRCDVHPDMAGTMVAQSAPAAAAKSVPAGTSVSEASAVEPAPEPAPAPR